jgi:hypothetical protein
MKARAASETAAVIYSCAFKDYDFDFEPFATTPGAAMLRFTDARPYRGVWERQPIPAEASSQGSQLLANRFMKMFPGRFLPDADVAVYVDGNILIKSALSPLLEEFRSSDADIALFWHRDARTLAEEIDFAIKHRVRAEQRDLALAQRARYEELGILDRPVTENSIIFYRPRRTVTQELGAVWWDETLAYAHRDQFSLPYALSVVPARVHHWSWHFKSTLNPFFDQYPHRYGSRHNQRRLAAEFLGRYRLDQRVLSYLIHPPKIIESALKRIRPVKGRM